MNQIAMGLGVCALCIFAVWYLYNWNGVQQWLDDMWDGGNADDLRKRFDQFGRRRKHNLLLSIPDFLMGKIEERAYEAKAPLFIRAFKTLTEIGIRGLDYQQGQALVHAYIDNKMCDDTFDYDGACLMSAQLWEKIPEVLAIRLCTLNADISPIMKHVQDHVVKSAIRICIDKGDGHKLLQIATALPGSISEADSMECMGNTADEGKKVSCLIATKEWETADLFVDELKDEAEAGRLLLAMRKDLKQRQFAHGH